jgi:hypothetical protein
MASQWISTFILFLVAVKFTCVIEKFGIYFMLIGVCKYGRLMYEIMYKNFPFLKTLASQSFGGTVGK